MAIEKLSCVDGVDSNEKSNTSKFLELLNNAEKIGRQEFLKIFSEFKLELNQGVIRVAEKVNDHWKVNHWVKRLILLGFKHGILKEYGMHVDNKYFEKDTLGSKRISHKDNIRVVSTNVTIRDGTFVAPGVICMPPSFINIGAYVDENTLIDSNSLVGSCAQIGKNVHLSAGAQIGGVLEPIGEFPVIIEDNVFIGGNCGIYDGSIIKQGAIIGAGTIITGSISVYDVVNKKIYSRTKTNPLIIPEGAVVVPGARIIENQVLDNVKLSLQAPVIIKYVGSDNSSVKLEDALRS